MRLVILAMWVTFLFSPSTFGQTRSQPNKVSDTEQQVSGLKKDVENLSDTVEIIKRDQLNYKTEKDLLKDAFTANIQTIQLIITAVLGGFTILGILIGYVGFKGILAVKSDYEKELETLKITKTAIEAELKKLLDGQNAVEVALQKVEQENEVQGKQLKLLEIKEKVSQAYANKSYYFASEYVEAGLTIAPKDVHLLEHKAMIFLKLRRFPEAVEAFKKVIEVDPNNIGSITNLAELLLLVRRTEEFDKFFEENSGKINERQKLLKYYFQILRKMCDEDVEGMKTQLEKLFEQTPEDATPHLGTWGFQELDETLKALPQTVSVKLMARVSEFLAGRANKEATRKLVEAIAA